MHQLTDDPIHPSELLSLVSSRQAGAVVLFLGTVRELTGTIRTVALHYESYPAMALKQLGLLEAEARQRWPLIECVLVHRLGRLEPAEISVAVAVSSPHRREAFAAAEWLIDRLKVVVPIWKEETQ